MRGLAIRRKLAMVVAAVVTAVGVGTLQGSSAGNDRERTYNIFNLNSDTVTSTYTLALEEQYGTSTYSLPGVIGEDDRIIYNNSGIVYLLLDNQNLGTGFVVGDHTIATAAHCLYGKNVNNPGAGTFSTSVDVRLFDNNGNLVNTVSAVESHIPQEYIDCTYTDRHKYDYALLTVSADLSDYEHFKIGEVLTSAATTGTFNIYAAGFPSKTLNDDGTVEDAYWNLYVGSGIIDSDDDYRIWHTVDTTGGQSGGPIFVNTTYRVGSNDAVSQKTAIGVINSVGSDTNVANKFTAEHLQFYLNNAYATYEE